MNTRPRPVLRPGPAGLLVLSVSLALLSGCASLVGKPAPPLLAQRDEPSVVLCQSQRIRGGGIRLIGRLNRGIYPLTGATIQYRSAGVSDSVPATTDPKGQTLVLANPGSSKGAYRKDDDLVEYVIDGADVRRLGDKVIWYRWIIDYDRGGSRRSEATDIHRTSYEEAGLPRDPGSPGPDSSVGLPASRRR